MIEPIYPSEDIYNTFKKNFEHLILWMLSNNEECEWCYFTQAPLNFSTSTLSKYINLLKSNGYVEKISRGHYKITPNGRERFHEISRTRGKIKKLNYPPEIIKKKREYEDWILWMVYNNTYCKWSDFIEEPLSINRSSLSKKMNFLLVKDFIKHENKEYKITHSGKLHYSKMLKKYDLDRQSILDEESKRIEEITKNTIAFFDKYNITNGDIQFRYLHNVLNLDYARVKTMLTNEEEFYKILLYLSINHPDSYPDFISMETFSKIYEIKKAKLEYYIDEIVEHQIYPIKFFKLVILPNECYYFQENEKIEVIIRAITEEYITKLTYINKLYSRSMDLRTTINNVLNDLCGKDATFNGSFKEPLRAFLRDYINYLAYKIEAKVDLRRISDKLEGIIWQDMIDLIQVQSSQGLKLQYEDKIEYIEEEIKLNPDKFELYLSKISILLYYEQLDEALNLLDIVSEKFPENEIDILIKKASVLKRMQKIEKGLDIINDLINSYPENKDLLNYKVYWLQYLNRKEEALDLIQDLVEKVPSNGMYHDTYGEILMNFEEYDKAIDKFLRAIDLSTNEWYINQTYIKLGICYKELKKFDLAIKNLRIGKKLMEESLIDPETKQKWLVIVNIFLSEIE